ncbi:O-Glycosyl hydrolase family 30 [compost metagenome]
MAWLLRYRSSLYTMWVPVANQNGGPNNAPFHSYEGPKSNAFMQTIQGNESSYTLRANYWMMGAFSRYIKRDAVRISHNLGSATNVTPVAFKNPDGKIAVVVVNSNTTSQNFYISAPSGQISATLPAKTVGTYVWTPTGAGTGTGTVTNYEAESQVNVVSSGDSTTAFADTSCSNGQCLSLLADGTNDNIAFTLNIPTTGTYDVKVGVKKGSSRGKLQMSVNNTNYGNVEDLYSSSFVYEELNIGLVPLTSGNQQIKFTVTGKNNSSTDYDLVFDYIKLTKQ